MKKGIIGKKIGMTQPQLAKIENLDSIPTLPTLNKYAAGLGLQIKLSISPLMEAKQININNNCNCTVK